MDLIGILRLFKLSTVCDSEGHSVKEPIDAIFLFTNRKCRRAGPGMRILLTGGSGFLGARAIPRLVADGHVVFALARSAASQKKVDALGASPIAGDLENLGTLALPAIDAVVHAAGHLSFAGPRAPYIRINVTGTQSLLRVAKEAGAHTFVHLSAAAVVLDDKGSVLRNIDEQAPTFPDSFSAYIASKARGEALVLEANQSGFRTIALRPPAIWGPGDMIGTKIPAAVKSGKFAFVDRGDFPFLTCHVDNVIEAVLCALQRGPGGRAFFINDGQTTTFRSFVEELVNLQGLSLDGVRSVGYPFAYALGSLMELGSSIGLVKGDPPLSRTMVRMTGRAFTARDAAARRELGYVGKVSREDGMKLYVPG